MNPISKPDFMPVEELRKMQLAKLQDLIPAFRCSAGAATRKASSRATS